MKLGGLSLSLSAQRGGGVSLSIAVSEDGAYEEITVSPGTFTVDGVEVATADVIGQPPVLVSSNITYADVDVSGTITAGDTWTLDALTYVWDPAGSTPELSYAWKVGPSYVGAGTSYSATGTENIDVFGLDLEITMTNGNGATVETVPAYAVAPYVEQGLSFSGGQRLVKSTGLIDNGTSGVNVDSILIAFNFTAFESSGQYPFRTVKSSGFGNAVGVSSDVTYYRAFVLNASEQAIVNFKDIAVSPNFAAGDRIQMLLWASKTGLWILRGFVNGTLVSTLSETATVDGTQILTSTALTIGQNFSDSIYDLRAWPNAAQPDFDDPSTLALFMEADGTTVDQAYAETVFGAPHHWMPTDPVDANALDNLGTGLNYTSKVGTFA